MPDCLNARPPARHRVRALRPLSLGAVWLVLCATSVGCLRGQAKALPEVPLDVPAPPPRSVEVKSPEEPPLVSFPEEPATTPPPRPRPTPAPRVESRPAEPRVESSDPAKPADDAARTAAPTLQTAPTQQEGEAERRVRAQLLNATATLNRINVQGLNADARQQLDTARRFVSQAEDALRNRNLLFAGNLADKAAALAAQLSGR